MTGDLSLPDFICVGAPKSGTSWLYDALSARPDVFIAAAKGTNFFDREYARGLDWYAAHFAKAPPGAIRGEISHDYYSRAEAPARIARDLPDVKLVCVLREPGDFVSSNIRWLLAHTRSYGEGVSGIWANPEIRRNAAYLEVLTELRRHFGPERLLVLYYEHLRDEPDAFLNRILAHIGAAQAAEAPRSRVNPTTAARSAAAMRLVFAGARAARSLGLGGLVGRVKRAPLARAALYSETPVTLEAGEAARLEDAKAEARAAVAADLNEIERLIGAPAPDYWREKAG